MSQNQLIRQSLNSVEQNEQQPLEQPVIGIYEPKYIRQQQLEQQMIKFYYPFNYQCCGIYQPPDMREILKKKRLSDFHGQQRPAQIQLMPYDGTYEQSSNIDMNSDEITRQKYRNARDERAEFFYDNGELLVEKDFFQEQLSRLANISYEDNMAIRTFHKNAILSERNNQKKNVSFQLVINFGDLWFNNHRLQSDEEIKFQEIRPLIREWYEYSTYPILPELKKQIDYLQDLKYQREQRYNIKTQRDKMIQQIDQKMKICQDLFNKQKQRVQNLMKKIIQGWKQIKNIRKNTGIESVPFKLLIKEAKYDGKTSYDLGINQFQTTVINAHKPEETEAEKKRREQIKSQRYYLKVYINDNEVAKTAKFNLQWPSFKVHLNEQVNITVYSAPYKIYAEIVKVGFIDQVVDVVNLSLPGTNAKTITASERKISYASFSSDSNKKQIIQQNKQGPKSSSGMVFYSIEWKGQGSRMPPSTMAKSSEEQTACTDSQTDTSERRENIDLLFDVKDPRRQQKSIKLRAKQQIKQKNSLLPFNEIYSTRLMLLKLRNKNPQLEKIMIPLREQEARRRPDILTILDKEKNKNQSSDQSNDITFFHPTVNDYYKDQSQPILNDIKAMLQQIQNLKVASNRSNASTLKYKVTEQIIDEHIFQQMQSPIVVFLKNIFTQKRKLGPQNVYKIQSGAKVNEFGVNVHIRSARNLPIRQNSSDSVKKYLEQENRLNNIAQMVSTTMKWNFGNFFGQNQMHQNYGFGLYNQRPSVGLGMNRFYTNNMFQSNRMNQQNISYEGKNALERVNTRVQLRFKKFIRVSQCFEGPFPEWNQTLKFNYLVKPENSIDKIFYNNEKLIKLIVFDLTEESKQTQKVSGMSLQKSKFYLGRIEVPFSLITMIPAINGIFKLDRPLVLFSYSVKKQPLFNYDIQNNNNESNLDVSTYINLDMFVEPNIDTSIAYNTDRKFIPGVENTLILQKASDWLEQLNTKRYVKLWLNNLDNKSIFISRFLSDNIAPPDLSRNKIIEKIAKFVSMIPLKYNCKLMQNTEQYHLKVDEFLKLKMGDDHGILLCNYFNYIDKKLIFRSDRDIESYLVLGKAFPYGKSIFVLRRDKKMNNCEIWDPFKGQSYFFQGKEEQASCLCFTYKTKKVGQLMSKDICPMFEVTCIVSKQNVFVNQQESTNPYLMEFDLQNTTNWIPFLTQRTRNDYFEGGKITTIQPQINSQFYKQYPENDRLIKSIENELTNYIKDQIRNQRMKLSTTYVTRFNAKIQKKVNQKLLLYCQNMKNDFRMIGKDSTLYDTKESDYQEALGQLEKEKGLIKVLVDTDKNIFGFTLNFTLTTKQEIWQKIQDTQIHFHQNQNMEFVLGVKCFQYPCHLYSVWVFIGAVQ